MAAKSQDKILFGAATILLLVSAGWMAIQRPKIFPPAGGGDSSVSDYTPSGIDAPSVNTKTWPAADHQSSGAEWIYDVFTPPEIYYNSGTKQFSVKPPDNNPSVPDIPVAFGVDLVQIKPDVFRLQLVGYVGSEGDYRGTFENALSGQTVIGRAGKTFPDLGLAVKSFEVRRNVIKTKESMPIYETEAIAAVVDIKTGDEVLLSNKVRRTQGEPFAVLKADGNDSVQRRVGESFQVGAVTYTIVNVTTEPPSAEVRKQSPDMKDPVIKILTPVTPAVALPESSVAPKS